MSSLRFTAQEIRAITDLSGQFRQHYGQGYQISTAPRGVIVNNDALIELCNKLVTSVAHCELFCDRLSTFINKEKTDGGRLIVVVAQYDILQKLGLPMDTLVIMIYPNYAIHTTSVDKFKQSCHKTRLFKIGTDGVLFFPFDPAAIM